MWWFVQKQNKNSGLVVPRNRELICISGNLEE